MGNKVTDKQKEQALTTLFEWFIQENNKEPIKPITVLDTTFFYGQDQFRILTHFSFYGRDEKIQYKEVK